VTSTLPIKTSIEDVEKIIAYLKTKPTGATLEEAKSVIDSKHLDGRKVRAYKVWGIIKDQERLELTTDGWTVARDSSKLPDILRGIIDRTRPYRGAVEWAHHQSFDSIEMNDLAANWHSHHKEALGTSGEETIKLMVTCFFAVADGAGLGTYKLGRRGQVTRLDLDKAAVRAFVEAGPSTPPWSGPEVPGDDEEEPEGEMNPQDKAEGEQQQPPARETPETPDPTPSGPTRVFIAHGANMRVVEQVQTMLELADIVAEVAEEEESTAIPVPNKVLTAMRRSHAGIVCVSVDESRKREDGTYTINENVLIEIGAAFVLYDTKVILLWDKRLDVPSNLQGLYRCEFEGDEIGWTEGMKLMKAVSKFKKAD
jgi:predicted nucleotide-binding protein